MKLKHKANMQVAEVAQFVGRQAAHVYPVDGHRTRVGTVQRAYYLQ